MSRSVSASIIVGVIDREESATSERGWVNDVSAGVEWGCRRMAYHRHNFDNA
jgi:hypothetical protein